MHVSERKRERERLKLWVFLTFNIIITHIFPENFIEIREVVQKVFFFDINYFSQFFRFFSHFLVTKKLMTSAYNR